MTQHQLNLLALVSIVVCWCFRSHLARGGESRPGPGPGGTDAFLVRNSRHSRPDHRGVVNLAVPKAEWRSLTFSAPPARTLGLVILLAATAFTIWARLAIGAMWSGAPAVKQEQQLRTNGPYSVTRHPIYTGVLGMPLGCLLVTGGRRWIVPFPAFLVLLEIKLHIEERLMQAEFPGDYPRYRQRVPQLAPGLKLLSRRRIAIG